MSLERGVFWEFRKIGERGEGYSKNLWKYEGRAFWEFWKYGEAFRECLEIRGGAGLIVRKIRVRLENV